ncbi:hypothetical protein PHJA_000767400 [Phtheirospermum japonicum]|uniref:Steroid 5-alpha reductase C-terminal domain-containing protein n=1 Tax=Phtheirospermum japonicum TaxID=374723 RepID=A0A830BH69_9LAMI|nr:hypothetical protein PHJA_000767400 [Phtheirospermum japonicum]
MARVLDSHFLALTAIVTVAYQLFFFVITALLKFDKVTDFAGSTNFVILAVLTLIVKGSWNFRQVVLSIFVVIWGLRLGLFLLMRIIRWGEDRRFDNMRDNLGKLAVFWVFQAVWVWTVSLPVTVVNASDRDPSIRAEDIIGWVMWALGLFIEATADQQKLNFKNSPENRGKWCDVGVWKYSRHPNYFGEVKFRNFVSVHYTHVEITFFLSTTYLDFLVHLLSVLSLTNREIIIKCFGIS